MTDPASQPSFSVDTGLFRQLGELLVGRDATALVELVKNAYDADATEVVLKGTDLDTPAKAVLLIADDGVGMTPEQFRHGFLRVAARTRTSEGRNSSVYRRRYTGEKGVGRLAAHKLASRLEVVSVSATTSGDPAARTLRAENSDRSPEDLLRLMDALPRTMVEARINWDAIEEFETLDDIDETALMVIEASPTRRARLGTTITLRTLRRAWTSVELGELSRQLSNFEPPALLTKRLSARILAKPALFAQPTVRDSHRGDPGLRLRLEGDLARPAEYWASVGRNAEWVLEIDASRGEDVKYAVAPTNETTRSNAFSRSLEASAPHPAPLIGPFFQARVLVRSGPTATLDDPGWAAQTSGIRVYLEGFRVLPYGEMGNDWLRLDFHYTRRSGRFQLDPLLSGPQDDLQALRSLKSRDYSLRLLPNRNFFGAVFLTDRGAAPLRSLVNREGFVPDEHFDRLSAMVRNGTELVMRARALANYQDDEARRRRQEEEDAEARSRSRDAAAAADQRSEDRESGGNGIPGDHYGGDSDPRSGAAAGASDNDSSSADASDVDHEPVDPDEWRAGIEGSGARLLRTIRQLHTALPADSPPELVTAVNSVDRAAGALVADVSLLRVLSSVGGQIAAFHHEVQHLLPSARSIEAYLAPQPGRNWPAGAIEARRAIRDLRTGLERQAAYLTDVVSTESRSRRTRLSLRDRFEVASRALQGPAAQQDVAIENQIPRQILTPPMFPAELLAIMTNLLTNALKAAGRGGIVRAAGDAQAGRVRLVLQNTGVAVDPVNSERLFQPFASENASIDAALGLGTGLGLPITRGLLAEYGGSIRFIDPEPGFASSVEVLFVE